MAIHSGKLFGVPNIPNYYLQRPDQIDRLRELIATKTRIAVTAVDANNRLAVQGMGGIGKTVLVAMLCRNGQVRETFPDGIYWLTFGTTPSLERLYAQLINWLEGKPTQLRDIASLRFHLIGLLHDKRCLLILDDIWDLSHSQGFVDLGNSVSVILTTRKQDIAVAVDSTVFPLELLEATQARQLLAYSSETSIETLPAAASGILKECNGLPLAVDMIGKTLQGKPEKYWETVLEQLKAAQIDQIHVQHVGYPVYNNLWGVIDVSVQDLDPDSQSRYLDFAIFPDDVFVPEATLVTYWKPKGLTAENSRRVLRTLVNHGLLLKDSRCFKLHDLQLDYVRRVMQQQGSLHGLHAQLLRAYNPDDLEWYEVADDGYLYLQLGYHLEQLGRLENLHSLVTKSPQWRDAKFKACEGDAAFTEDVQRLLSRYREPLSPTQVIKVAELSAVQQVIHARTSRYEDVDLQTLVWLGRLREAVSYARLRSYSGSKFSGLFTIWNTLRTRQKQQINTDSVEQSILAQIDSELIDLVETYEVGWKSYFEALIDDNRSELVERLVQHIQEVSERAIALSTIASIFSRTGQPQARDYFTQAGIVAQEISDTSRRNEVITTIIGDLVKANEYGYAETLVFALEQGYWQVNALCTIANALAQTNQPRATEIFLQAEKAAHLIVDSHTAAYFLRSLGLALAKGHQPRVVEILTEAVPIANRIERLEQRVEALRDIAHALAEVGEYDRAEAIANSITYRQAEAFDSIARVLFQTGQYDQAEGLLARINNTDGLDDALTNTSRVLAEGGQYDRAETLIRRIKNAHYRSRALGNSARILAQEGEYNRAEVLAYEIEDVGYRNYILSIIARTIAEAREYDRAETLAHRIENPRDRSAALRTIANLLAQENLPHAVEVFAQAEIEARRVENKQRVTEAIRDMILALVQVHAYDQAEVLAENIEDAFLKAESLRAIARGLARRSQPQRASIMFNQAETAARGVNNYFQRREALQKIAFDLVQVGEYDRAEAVVYLAESNPDDALGAMIGILNKAQEYDRLETLIHRLSNAYSQDVGLYVITEGLAQTGEYDRAETLANQIKDASWRCRALSTLARGLAQAGDPRAAEFFAQAEAAVSDMEPDHHRAEPLRVLIMALAQVGEYSQAETLARTIQSESWRFAALKDVVFALTQASEYDHAERFARSIETVFTQSEALCIIVTALAQAGEYDHAERLARSIETAFTQSEAFDEIAIALTQARDYDRAEALIHEASIMRRHIDHSPKRRDILRDAACIMADNRALLNAFRVLGSRDMPGYLSALTCWQVGLESIQAGLLIRTLHATLTILAWEQDYWAHIADTLA